MERAELKAEIAKRHVIQLAEDRGDEGREFAKWLQRHGHNARVAALFGDYVDGAATWGDETARETLRYLEDCWMNDT